jgi:ribosome-associated protein
MPLPPELYVSAALAIPRTELLVRASRSGGAGGQHVNTSATRVEVAWNIATSSVLSEAQRERLKQRLDSRLSDEGVVRVVASERRSQAQNREAAEERLAALIRRALVVPRKRRPTTPSRAAREQRLQDKHRRSRVKRDRRADYD